MISGLNERIQLIRQTRSSCSDWTAWKLWKECWRKGDSIMGSFEISIQ